MTLASETSAALTATDSDIHNSSREKRTETTIEKVPPSKCLYAVQRSSLKQSGKIHFEGSISILGGATEFVHWLDPIQRPNGEAVGTTKGFGIQ